MGGEATKLLRSSIHGFLRSYHSYTSVAALLVFPVSASVLFSQALVASSSSSAETLRFNTISSRLRSLFEAASFPHSFSSLAVPVLSQSIFSSFFALPFTLTFLVLAKASVAQTAIRRQPPPPFSSLLRRHYPPLLLTQLFNSFLVLSANASTFSLLFLLFNAASYLGLQSSTASLLLLLGALLYSVAVANTVATCNLATAVSAAENCRGYLPVVKACVLVRGRAATALSLALPTSLAMAAVEALFRYRVTGPYRLSGRLSASIVAEGVTIAYIHSILVVLEIIASCLFYKSCRQSWEDDQLGLEPELDKCAVRSKKKKIEFALNIDLPAQS